MLAIRTDSICLKSVCAISMRLEQYDTWRYYEEHEILLLFCVAYLALLKQVKARNLVKHVPLF